MFISRPPAAARPVNAPEPDRYQPPVSVVPGPDKHAREGGFWGLPAGGGGSEAPICKTVDGDPELMTLKVENILVPLDGSALSNAALPLVRTLARATNASVTLMRVMPRGDPLATLQAEEHLQKIAEELAGPGSTVASVVREGRAADEILAQARTLPASMVVMRTRGRAGLERALLGSVTEQVLKHGDVPLVLMRPGERRVTAIRQPVVPVTAREARWRSIQPWNFARATGASITLVQVAVPVANRYPWRTT